MIIENKRNKNNIIFQKSYRLWKNMMERCYNKNNKDFKRYGNQNVIVCEKWKNFNNFVEDMDKIKGFNIELFLKGKICLDKDKIETNNKIYCLEKCCFISREENNKYKPNKQKDFIAINPNGEKFFGRNIKEFSLKHNLEQRRVSEWLKGYHKPKNGWEFYYL